jgi:prefoldin subunit 5
MVDVAALALEALDGRIHSLQQQIDALEMANTYGQPYSKVADKHIRLEALRREIAECKATVKSVLQRQRQHRLIDTADTPL